MYSVLTAVAHSDTESQGDSLATIAQVAAEFLQTFLVCLYISLDSLLIADCVLLSHRFASPNVDNYHAESTCGSKTKVASERFVQKQATLA